MPLPICIDTKMENIAALATECSPDSWTPLITRSQYNGLCDELRISTGRYADDGRTGDGPIVNMVLLLLMRMIGFSLKNRCH